MQFTFKIPSFLLNLFTAPPVTDLASHYKREGTEGTPYQLDIPIFHVPKLDREQHRTEAGED